MKIISIVYKLLFFKITDLYTLDTDLKKYFKLIWKFKKLSECADN